MFVRHGRHALTERTTNSLRCPCELLNVTPPVSRDRLKRPRNHAVHVSLSIPTCQKTASVEIQQKRLPSDKSRLRSQPNEEDSSSAAVTAAARTPGIGGVEGDIRPGGC